MWWCSCYPVRSVNSLLNMIINMLFVFVATLDSVTSKFNILNSRDLEYYKQKHNISWKKTNKNIAVRTNTIDSTRDSCLVHYNHTIKKKIVSKKIKKTRNGLGACLVCNISYSRNKLDTTGIHFGAIKNELVQVKRYLPHSSNWRPCSPDVYSDHLKVTDQLKGNAYLYYGLSSSPH